MLHRELISVQPPCALSARWPRAARGCCTGQHVEGHASAYNEKAWPGLLGVGGGTECGEPDYQSKGLHTEA